MQYPGKIIGIVLIIGGSLLLGHDLTININPLSLLAEGIMILIGLSIFFRKK